MSDDSNPVLVEVDWDKVDSKESFYDLVLPQCESPHWHGRNLDALNDSWVTGGIDKKGPPYSFRFKNGMNIDDELIDFKKIVEEIAQDSVKENGGSFESV